MELTVRKNGEGAKFIGFGNGESGDFQENIYSKALRIEARLVCVCVWGGGAGRVKGKPKKPFKHQPRK